MLFQSTDGHTIAENGPFRCPEGVRGGLEQHTALVGGTKRRRMDQVYGSSRKASFKERKHSSGEKSAVFPLSARIPREFMEIELSTSTVKIDTVNTSTVNTGTVNINRSFSVDHLFNHFVRKVSQLPVDHFGVNHLVNHFGRKDFPAFHRSFWVNHFAIDHFGSIILQSII